MKKFFIIITALACALFSFSSCAEAEKDIPEEPQINLPPSDGEYVVCIDPGHGFGDIGCTSEFLNGTEAEVNLSMAMLLKDELSELGCTVILTHDGETFPSAEEVSELCESKGIDFKSENIVDNDVFSPYERAFYSIALNREKSIDLFISLHVNSVENAPEVSRYEIDYYENNPYADALGMFSKDLSATLDKKTQIYADTYDMAFIVTKFSDFPSVLLEMGYASNEGDAKDLNSQSFRKAYTKTLAREIYDFISLWENI